MRLYWENLGANVLTLKTDAEWRIYAELDEYEWAYIYLEVNGQKYEICWSSEHWPGNEHVTFWSYSILEFYSAVVRRVYELICSENLKYLDLVELQEKLLTEHWREKLKSEGITI